MQTAARVLPVLRGATTRARAFREDFTSGANGDSSPRSPADEKKRSACCFPLKMPFDRARKLDRALERKTNAKQAEIRRDLSAPILLVFLGMTRVCGGVLQASKTCEPHSDEN